MVEAKEVCDSSVSERVSECVNCILFLLHKRRNCCWSVCCSNRARAFPGVAMILDNIGGAGYFFVMHLMIPK